MHTKGSTPTVGLPHTGKASPPRGIYLFTGGTFDSLKVPDFRWYFSSCIAYFLAAQMQQIARGWLAYELTKSPLDLGYVLFSFAAPQAVFSIFGGALADRVSKVKLIVACQLFNTVLTITLATMILTHFIQFWHLIVFGLLNGTSISFQVPGRQVLVNEIVPENKVMNAIALNSSGSNLAKIIGPAVAGVLISAFGTAFVFYLMGGLYFFSILSISRIKETGRLTRRLSGFRKEMLEGVKYVFSNSVLLNLVIMAFVANLIGMMAFQGLMPAWSVEALNMDASGLGLLLAVMGAGAVIGSLIVASLGGFKRRGLLLILTSLVWSVFIGAFALSNHIVIALTLLVIVGLLGAVYLSLNQTLTQIHAAAEMRGRAMSMNQMAWGIAPIGVLPISWLAQHIGTPHAIAISAVIFFAFALLYSTPNARMRKLE